MAAPARVDKMTVEELLRWAREGRLRVPSFQRPLKWDASDKRDLLDSMERGYPIGTLLLWKRPASAQGIGVPLPGGSERPETGDVYLLVDGQQRVTTLWEALGRAPAPGDHAMFFDLQTGFQYRQSRRGELDLPPVVTTAVASPVLPLTHALDATTLSEWVPHGLSREAKRLYFDLGKRLREYPIPIYVVESDDVDALREVFDRINSAGKRLTRDDVFDALIGSRVTRPEGTGLDLVRSQLEDLGFGTLQRSSVLEAFDATQHPTEGRASLETDTAEVERRLLRTSHALRRAVAFLQKIGVPHLETLPYDLPLIVLTSFFALFPQPAERNLVLLRRWFWRASVCGRLSGASGSLKSHLDDVLLGDEHGSVQRLIRRTGAPTRPDLADMVRPPFSAASARGKVVLCALLSQSPRSLLDGDRIVSADLFRDGIADAVRHIVAPRSTPSGTSIANRLIHPRSGAQPSRLIGRCSDEGALASHGIDVATREALRGGDVESFLRQRAERLIEWAVQFVDRQAEWSRDDLPSVTAMASGAVRI